MHSTWVVAFTAPLIAHTRRLNPKLDVGRCALHGTHLNNAAPKRCELPAGLRLPIEAKKKGGGGAKGSKRAKKRASQSTPSRSPKSVPSSSAASAASSSASSSSASSPELSAPPSRPMASPMPPPSSPPSSPPLSPSISDVNPQAVTDSPVPTQPEAPSHKDDDKLEFDEIPLSSAYPGPISPDLLEMDGPFAPDMARSPNSTEQDGMYDAEEDGKLPIDDESKLKLPDLSSRPSIKRKRKPLMKQPSETLDTSAFTEQADGETSPAPQGSHTPEAGNKNEEDGTFSADKVRELTTAYRLNDAGRQTLIDELEKEPDFVLQSSAGDSEYDLASAIFGTGKPNKQGVYVLPSLQSAHVVLLGISSIAAFVYFPGFPLTEGSEGTRLAIKTALALVFATNGVLAYLAFQAAGSRNQPRWFWAAKTFILGELAFGELRRNTKVVTGSGAGRTKAEKAGRRKKAGGRKNRG